MSAAVDTAGVDDRRSGLALWWASVRIVLWRGNLRTIRFPGLLVAVAFFPVFFLVAYAGLFPRLTDLPGFPTDNFTSWLLPFTLLQAAAFSGLGAGFAAGNDIETGFFDRLLMMPAHRSAILLGTALMSLVRAVAIGAVVGALGLVIGAELNGGVLGVVLLFVAICGVSMMSSCFALGVMYRAKDQRVAPAFQLGIFMVLFTSTAQVPVEVTTGWLEPVARVNPTTFVLALARQATLESGVSWSDTWPGLVAIIGGLALLGAFAVRGLARFTP